MMAGKRLFFIVLCLLFYLSLIQEAGAFSVDPARIELSIAPGRQRGKVVNIDNSKGTESLHLKIYLQDIIFLPDGTNDFPVAGSTDWSCAKWVKVIPEEVDIPAGKAQNIRVSVSVPGGVSGGYYAMLFFETGPIYQTQGVGINFRLGALIDVTVANTGIRKAKLANIVLPDPNKIEVSIFNEGNILIRPKGRIKILDARGKKKLKQIDFNQRELGVLPKTLRKFYVELKEPLASGKYVLKAEIDYGTKYLLVGELPIDIE